jgi:hypothetical protein
MKNIEKKEKFFLILLVVVAVIVLILRVIPFSKEKSNIEIDSQLIVPVTDANRFFTINSCVQKMFSYLSNKDTDSLYKILNSQYIDKNAVTTSNVLTKFPSLNGNYSFTSKKMYQQQLSENVYKYYIYGYYQQELMNKIGNREDYYLIVYLYTDNMTFAVEPYDGYIFKE